MKEIDKKRASNNRQAKRPGKTERRDRKPHQTLNGNRSETKAFPAKPDSSVLVSDSNTGSEPSEVYENMVIHYLDDVNRFEEAPQGSKASAMIDKLNKDEILDDHSTDLEKESKNGREEESDSDTIIDSVSSHADSVVAEDEKVERLVGVPKSFAGKNGLDGSRGKSDHEDSKSEEPSEGVVDKPVEEVKDTNVLDQASNGTKSVINDNEIIDADENGEPEDEAVLNQRIEDLEMKIEKLEEELREVAALEISLYSVVSEHGSSAHKVHTPARRLSRLYIHACKHWTQNKWATIAKNTISGLVLIAKSCGNDVPRLTFWLSNTVVLREIISQAFGSSHYQNPQANFAESNGSAKRNDSNEGKRATLKWKGGSGNKLAGGFLQFSEDWQETRTFITALEKVESWMFSRIVESVWWQALTPHMQSPKDLSKKSTGKLLGPALGDQQQGSFSVNLWKNAFQDAFQRLCPVRAGGHECGCLPVIARLVMEQCVARLDVAMFNAILRESVHEIPTDPISDPIVDPKVLPIPAGDMSFGSGAQLKNSVGNWSRWLTDMFGMDTDDSMKEQQNDENDEMQDIESKCFLLLNDLSDLLMLPKDMLMDRSMRKQVCPSISLALIKRILCNFTPDEFCPDPVPGDVLEVLNAESIIERRMPRESAKGFPYAATPVLYTPPSSADVAEKIAEAGGRSQLSRNASVVQRKGYTSDEELEELDCPLTSIIEKLPSSPSVITDGQKEHSSYAVTNARYELLREVWSM
ncbi:hypothetical protein K2173_019795 [Erythroxylum novogranatense]|uniref:Dilute domain-containing protein n=1 Tax=Erythroxylum novogranatense TaxID=1862640 RepID=A0AAV8SM76_9ROSI|nr:hypothetical protein K2173_019795 [Erythroxylum novogranatense]